MSSANSLSFVCIVQETVPLFRLPARKECSEQLHVDAAPGVRGRRLKGHVVSVKSWRPRFAYQKYLAFATFPLSQVDEDSAS